MAGENISTTFNVFEDDYQEFINKLRSLLKKSISHDIFVLLPQTEALSWLDVHLTSGDSTITLRIDQRNLYVRGYLRDGAGERFWEFSDSTMISDSKPLAYSGSYIDGYTVVDAAGVTRETILLGSQNLSNAIATLATTADPNSTERDALKNCAKALLCLTQMIAESTRFQVITQHIFTNWYTPAPLTQQLVELEQSFGTFSSAVQRADYPNYNDSTPLPNVPNPNSANIWTVGQARAALGILLYMARTRNANTFLAAADSNASYFRTLVSIEYVRVLNIDTENPGDLYGTVRVKDFWGDHTVYDRSSGNSEKKGPGGFATLTGPSDAIDGYDVFVISVNLKDHDILSPDDVIADGDIIWEPRNEIITFANYNKPLEKVVSGEYGSVAVGYAVISQALNATISVALIKGDGESPADVYGTITASQDLGGSSTSISLFDKSSDEYIQVYPKDKISLTRSTVVAPMTSGITVTADLWDHDAISPNDEIAKGSAHFDAQLGTQTKSITGKYGEVQVSITCE